MAGEGTPRFAAFQQRSKATLRDRWHRLRGNVLLATQTGVAAGLAWFIAHNVLGHPQPFFAPIAAVITLAVSVGQRLRRAAELVLGVAVGIAVGDAIILLIGTGAWQIGLVVTLALLVAVFVGGTSPLLTQSASSAVLVATLAPPTNGIYYGRFFDALIGGLVGLAVMALLLPLNPLTVVSRAAGPALDMLADGLAGCATALETRDRANNWRLDDRSARPLRGGAGRWRLDNLSARPLRGRAAAQVALDRMRAGEEDLARFRDALGAARETATVAPLRWRARGPLSQYVDAADGIHHAVRNARVLARRCVSVLGEEAAEPVPDEMFAALYTLAEAVRELRRELAEGVEPVRTREVALAAVKEAAAGYAAGVGFSGSVVVAQVRSIATDLLHATGMSTTDTSRMIRRAAHRPKVVPAGPSHRPPMADSPGG